MKKNKFCLGDGFSVLRYSLVLTWRLRKSYLWLRLLIAFMEVLGTFWEIYFLRFLVNDIVRMGEVNNIVKDVVLLVSGIFVFKSIGIVCSWMASTGYVKLCDKFSLNSLEKKMRVKYQYLEDSKVLDQIKNLWRTDGIVSNSIEQLCMFVSGAFIFGGSIAILSSLNIFIVCLFVVITIINSYVTRKGIEKVNEIDIEKSSYDRKLNYYILRSINAADGKEVRVFQLKNFFLKKMQSVNNSILGYEDKKTKQNFIMESIVIMTNGIQIFFMYLYAAYKFLNKEILIADLFMYIATMGKLSSSFEMMIVAFQKIAAQKEQMDRLERYMQIPNENYSDSLATSNDICELEFRNVSFKYPGMEQFVLRDINLKICKGETISIVGKNGAGKSTFVKLVCRLYEPTEGVILLNGKDIKEYSYNEYLELIGTVFQDYRLIPFKIRDNLQLDNEMGETFLMHCLDKADILKKIFSLDAGLNTYLGKGTGYNGIDMSGGEKQKLAIGRMYAKKAKILILDEATAAVDPLSEDYIFSNINQDEAAEIIIFVSHRLSNAKISDKIIFIDNNKVMEYGSHDELMSNAGGYAELFMMQEQYYANEI